MLSNTFCIFILYCVLFTTVSANLKKVLCSYDDAHCVTESTKAIYPVIVAGRPGEVEASDPLLVDEILIKEQNVEFIFTKAKMTGLLNCRVKNVTVTAEKAYFIYHIWCPTITVGAPFEAHGQFNGSPFEGKGLSEITYNNYNIWLKGYYDKYCDEAGDLHTQVTNFDIELKPVEVIRNVTGPCFNGQHYAKGSLDDTRKMLELNVRKPIMYKFMQKYIKNLNKFLTIVPIKDIHYQLVAE